MGLNLDSYFNIHAQALQLRDKRTSQLANNLANTNTPNYKAKDIDFSRTLQSYLDGEAHALETRHPGHLSGGSDFGMQLQYRMPSQASLDGNTVDKDLETVAFSKNAVDYQATLSFLDSKVKTMMKAFRGE